MLYVQGFEDPETPCVVVGMYVNNTVISNDGYAFMELSIPQAKTLAAHVVQQAKEAEGL